MENQINTTDQNTQQIGKNINNQPEQTPEKSSGLIANLKKPFVIVGTSMILAVLTLLLYYPISRIKDFLGSYEFSPFLTVFLLVLIWILVTYLGGLLISRFIVQESRVRLTIYISVLSALFIIGIVYYLSTAYWLLPSGSFIHGTKVLMPEGLQSIENIKVGDQVVSYDYQANKYVISTVQKYRARTTREYYLINKLLAVTSEHPVAVKDVNGSLIWKRIRELDDINEKMVGYNGNDIEIYRIEKINALSPVYVYNPEISWPHNYFVIIGDSLILVHNKI